MAYSVGIDLGTTYSAAATARDGRIEIFQLGERAATIPSIVVLRADGEVLVGDAAERRSLSEPTRTAREFKRRLGDPTPIILGGTPYGAEALLAHLLKAIVARVSEQSGGPPDAIALTHPASYGAYKIDLLEQAIRQADVENVTLLTEPEAAAVHYAQQERVPAGAVIAVYDFGGGTFDATILRKTEDGFEQLGRPEGMERLGGIDFDEALFTRVMAQVRPAGVTVDPNDPADAGRHRPTARGVPAGQGGPVVRHRHDDPGRPARPPDRDAPDPRGIRGDDPAADHRDDRGARAGGQERGPRLRGVDRILLVGGSSRIPLVAEMVRESTGRPIAVDAHPKHSMALGAAFVAEQRRLAAQADSEAAAARSPRPRRSRSRRPPRTSRAGGAGAGSDAGRAAGAVAAAGAALPRGAPRAAGAAAGIAAGRCGAGAGLPPATPVETPGGGAFPPTEVVPVVGAGTAVAASADGGSNRNRTIAVAAAVGVIALVAACSASGRRGCSRAGRRPSPPASVAVVERRAARSPRRSRRRPSPTPVPTPTADPTPTRRPDADPDPGRSPGTDHRDHDHQRSVRRRLRGLRLHAGSSPAATCTSSSTPSRRGERRHARGRAVVPVRRARFRSPATRSATVPPPRSRCASWSPTPTIPSSRAPATAWTCPSARVDTTMGPGDLATEVRRIAAEALRVARGPTRRRRSAVAMRRLDEPLRVAIAGRVKAGKSTLLNALVGERLAATDAGECTRVVTWYRNALGYKVVAELGPAARATSRSTARTARWRSTSAT